MKQAIIVLITLIIGITMGFATAYTVTARGHYQIISPTGSILVRINTQTGKTMDMDCRSKCRMA